AKKMVATVLTYDGMPKAKRPGRESPLDLVHLAKQTLGDRSLEQEVLRLFLKQSELCLARIKGAVTSDERFQAAHTIKGSARNIGAWHVAEAALLIEGACEREQLADLDALEATLKETRTFIASLLDTH
ncbi:MAG: Hpt domain-containing protein, partial [Pseudomonadota bacterium]